MNLLGNYMLVVIKSVLINGNNEVNINRGEDERFCRAVGESGQRHR